MDKMKILEKVLREYQYKALKMCVKYLSSESKDNGHALVHLSIGTGKTGIMASICALNSDKNILIIVPNAILPIQTLNEIKEKFWVKLERKSNKKENESYKISDLEIDNLEIELLNDKEKLEDLKNTKGRVYISTV